MTANTFIETAILQKYASNHWQSLVELVTSMMEMSCCYISCLDQSQLRVLVVNQNNIYGLQPNQINSIRDALCLNVIEQDHLLAIDNITKDPDWSEKASVEHDVVSYLGMPIKQPDGTTMGTLCVFDRRKNRFQSQDQELLRHFARIVELELELLSRNREIELMSHSDPLTKLSNRLNIGNRFEQLISAGKRIAFREPAMYPVGVMMLDVDHFKKVNDEYGHTVGDLVLQHVADVIQSQSRDSDIVVRWGGEEFMVAASAISKEALHLWAEKIRNCVETTPFIDEKRGLTLNVTLSIGFVTGGDDGNWQSLIEIADFCLYQAKAQGRNRSCSIDETSIEKPLPEGEISSEQMALWLREYN